MLLTRLVLSANTMLHGSMNGRCSVFLSAAKCILPSSFASLGKGSEINPHLYAGMSKDLIHQ